MDTSDGHTRTQCFFHAYRNLGITSGYIDRITYRHHFPVSIFPHLRVYPNHAAVLQPNNQKSSCLAISVPFDWCLDVLQPRCDINHELVIEIPRFLIYFRIHFCTVSPPNISRPIMASKVGRYMFTLQRFTEVRSKHFDPRQTRKHKLSYSGKNNIPISPWNSNFAELPSMTSRNFIR